MYQVSPLTPHPQDGFNFDADPFDNEGRAALPVIPVDTSDREVRLHLDRFNWTVRFDAGDAVVMKDDTGPWRQAYVENVFPSFETVEPFLYKLQRVPSKEQFFVEDWDRMQKANGHGELRFSEGYPVLFSSRLPSYTTGEIRLVTLKLGEWTKGRVADSSDCCTKLIIYWPYEVCFQDRLHFNADRLERTVERGAGS